jgi:hypothetical protein
MYKSFYEQVFYEQGSMRVSKNIPQALEALQPYFKESEGIQGSFLAFLQDLPSKFFFPTSRLTQERKKV